MAKYDGGFYQELKLSVVQAFKLFGSVRFPLDPYLYLSASGAALLPYESGLDPYSLEDFLFFQSCPSGISFTLRNESGEHKIVGIANRDSRQRSRFTALHEFAHIWLNHRQDSELAENQVDFWAGYAIAPPVVVRQMGLTSPEEIADRFDVSLSCAQIAWKTYLNWKKFGRRMDADIDREILRLYHAGLMLDAMDQKSASVTDDFEEKEGVSMSDR